ncbi:uncharacterized protein LOC117112156 isoform X2 [Anneissia japonica]|uniref:uncharacterized protein LOC117112156 isoform X2 n=1 Tax=Anneissia japonica TaxID=1529436 RepID=UPI0014254EFE|nr:uncharacterized protein LOC117112156 isoform X2 [Anneissia japonica]
MAYFTILISTLYIFLHVFGLSNFTDCVVVDDDTSSNVLIPHASRNTQDYWISQAVEFIYQLDCTQNSQFITKSSCLALTKTSRESINIYIAAPTRIGARSERKYNTVLPDSSLRRSGSHDAVIAIDPFPEANFGHLVLVFYVDRKVESCRGKLEKSMGGKECLQVAVKHRCRNRLKTSSKRHCEINMLPLVYDDGDSSYEQQLKCIDSSSYARCPNFRTGVSNLTNNCELETNTKRCQNQKFGRRCKLHETCDYGVMISGGWNRQASLRRHADNIRSMYAMLRDQGFKKHNIKMFFADNTDIELYETSSQHVDNRFPATQKNAIRNHLSGLCSEGCNADSLIIYLNSPALPDGRSLLWDSDGNGQMDASEMLSVRELLEDIANCQAAHVYMIIDQSYSGIFADEIRKSNDHDNVVVFTSGNKTEYSWRSDLTDMWSHSNHTQLCVDEVYETYSDSFTDSTPRMLEGSMNAANTTVFGGKPCYLLPYMTNKEIRSSFMGCKYNPFGRHKI